MSRRAKLKLVDAAPRPTLADRLSERAYRPTYRPGEAMRCPACGSRAWNVGRVTAECSGCEAVLPIAGGGQQTEDRW